MGERRTGRGRRLVRLRAVPAVLIAAGIALAGCAQVVDGSVQGGLPAPSKPTGPTGFPSTTSAAPSTTTPTTPAPTTTVLAPSTPAATTPAARSLISLVEAAPRGSRPGTTAWDRLPSPTLTQFVHEYYEKKDWTSEITRLTGEGLSHVAHRVWTASDGVYADMVLLQYDDVSGALERYLGVSAATRADTTRREVALGGKGAPLAFYTLKADSYGNTVVATYAQVSAIVVELHTFNVGTWNRADVTSWIRTQIAALP